VISDVFDTVRANGVLTAKESSKEMGVRDIPEFLKNLPEARVLEQAQAEFLKASEELLAANRSARASYSLYDEELIQKTNFLNAAQDRMTAAEIKFDRAIEGMPGTSVKLTNRVKKIVRRTFAPDQQPEAIRLLEQKCVRFPLTEDTPEGLERNRLAVLKLSRGNLRELQTQIDAARIDWRDVLNAAEYPEASRDLSAYHKLDQASREMVDQRDRQQYLDWLDEFDSNGFLARIRNKLF